MDRDEVKVDKNEKKKERGQYSVILTEQRIIPKNFAFAETKRAGKIGTSCQNQ